MLMVVKDLLLSTEKEDTGEYTQNKRNPPYPGNSLAVQWSGLRAFTAVGLGSIPGQETKIPQASWCRKKKKNDLITIPRGSLLTFSNQSLCLHFAFFYKTDICDS